MHIDSLGHFHCQSCHSLYFWHLGKIKLKCSKILSMEYVFYVQQFNSISLQPLHHFGLTRTWRIKWPYTSIYVQCACTYKSHYMVHLSQASSVPCTQENSMPECARQMLEASEGTPRGTIFLPLFCCRWNAHGRTLVDNQKVMVQILRPLTICNPIVNYMNHYMQPDSPLSSVKTMYSTCISYPFYN